MRPFTLSLALVLVGCAPAASTPPTQAAPPAPAAASYDVLVRGGTIYDGHGGKGRPGDLAIRGDTIAAVAYAGELAHAHAAREIDARGLAVTPGFVNMLSGADESLIFDGRGQSDLRQGVTLEVMGEGESMGPWSDAVKKDAVAHQWPERRYDVTWTTLGEFLSMLETKGVSLNVTSFVGAATVRADVLGEVDRAPTPDELARMQGLVRQAMEEGAVGLSSALMYEPGTYAKTPELVALAKAVAPYHGIYISHVRNEGDGLLESLDELVTIARDAGVPAEIYHLKAAGQGNWGKLDAAIAKVEAARASGVRVTADVYTYTASATGLDAAMPRWVQEGGYEAWKKRLQDPAIRARVATEMRTPSKDWDNALLGAGSPDRVLFLGFKNPALRPLIGKTLADAAKQRGKSPEETAMDLVVEDGTRVAVSFFLMSEENVKREVALPWVSFCSDAEAPSAEGLFLASNPHPRAYGSFARVLGKYARDEHALSFEDAVRKLSWLPATNLGLARRGALDAGYYADVVVLDPARVADHATFDKPHQYATGVRFVLVNGAPVLVDGEPTGAKAGRFVRGPGWKGAR